MGRPTMTLKESPTWILAVFWGQNLGLGDWLLPQVCWVLMGR